jgi:hypothetical protein
MVLPWNPWMDSQMAFWVTSMHRSFGKGRDTISAANVPLHVVRYEDLKRDTSRVVGSLLRFLGECISVSCTRRCSHFP